LIVLPFETGFDGDICRHVMDGPEIPFVTEGLRKVCPITSICAKVLDDASQKMEIVGRLSPILPQFAAHQYRACWIPKTFIFTNWGMKGRDAL